MDPGNGLVGREAEHARIAGFAMRDREGPRGFWFTGEAGVGKTAL